MLYHCLLCDSFRKSEGREAPFVSEDKPAPDNLVQKGVKREHRKIAAITEEDVKIVSTTEEDVNNNKKRHGTAAAPADNVGWRAEQPSEIRGQREIRDEQLRVPRVS